MNQILSATIDFLINFLRVDTTVVISESRPENLRAGMKINYENIPRFIIPLFLAGTMTVALMSLFDLSRAISVILSLFAVVQLQKFEII